MVSEVIIPAAGLGTRMYPVTQGRISKHLLKINNKPVISYALEETINSQFKLIIAVANESDEGFTKFVKENY